VDDAGADTCVILGQGIGGGLQPTCRIDAGYSKYVAELGPMLMCGCVRKRRSGEVGTPQKRGSISNSKSPVRIAYLRPNILEQGVLDGSCDDAL
jgi:hypothetical protein